MNPVEQLTRRLLSGLCRHDDRIEVAVDDGGATVMIAARVARQDTPRVIGRGGAHFRALQTVLSEVVARTGKVARFRVLEPLSDGNGPDHLPPFELRVDWPKEQVSQLLVDVATAALGPVGAVATDDDSGHRTVLLRVPDRVPARVRVELSGALNTLFASIARTQSGGITVDIQ